jgi:hypothetical protein
MKNLKLTVGFCPDRAGKKDLSKLASFRQYIYDLHFPHYNPHICASGRSVNSKISLNDRYKRTMDLISWNQKHTKFKLTLLLNYLLHDNYKVVADNVVKEFYSRGVRSFVVADIELIKRLKDAMPDSEIQGSCLSHRMTEEELEEERREGVVLHNPDIDIIRNPVQLERNHKAGFAQKVIALEGCLYRCPDEGSLYGHRWYLARNIPHRQYFCNKPETILDPRVFLKANWVTMSRLKTLLPFINVVKLPRCGHLPVVPALKKFMRAFFSDTSYNIVDFICGGYRERLVREIGEIPSHLFNDNFFNTLDNCAMDCDKRGCRLCFDMMEKIKAFKAKSKSQNKLVQLYRRLRG